MKIRTPSGGYWGWHLLLGLVVFVAMTFVLAGISDEVMEGEPLTVTDAQLSNWLNANRTPAQVTVFKTITAFGSTLMAITLTTLSGIYLLQQRRRYWFATLVFAVAGGAILNRLLKMAFQRARPQFDDPIMAFTGFSFPSGHTLTATVLYGCLATLVVANTSSKLIRIVAIVSASILIALVGFSRIYLGAHYLSDVLAAIAEGLAWLSLSFTLVYSLWRHRKHAARDVNESD